MRDFRTAGSDPQRLSPAPPAGAPDPARNGPHLLTVVLEDYYQVGAFASMIPTDHWPRFESRIERNAKSVIELLSEANAQATIFVPGWIAERAPEAVRELTRHGHAIACQGYVQRRFDEHSQQNFRADLQRSRALVERAAGRRVCGFRIGQGGLDPANAWPLAVLAEQGFDYDSSLRPFGAARRFPAAERVIHVRHTDSGPLLEVPVSARACAGFCIPIAGGNFIRQLPVRFSQDSMRRWIRQVNAPLVGYFHAWELDPGQPRIAGAPRLQRLRHYRNLDVMRERVLDFVQSYSFTSIERLLGLDDTPLAVLPDDDAARPHRVPARVVENAASKVTTAGGTASAGRVSGASDSSPTTMAVSVVVPCYNEEANIAYLFNALRALAALAQGGAVRYRFELLFVDDGSTDATADTIRAHIDLTRSRSGHSLAKLPMRLLQHPVNRGIAAAVQTGIRAATTDVVCCIDCDCTFDPSHLLVMLPMLEPGVDLVVASPFMPGGRTENVPAWRRALSQGANRLYRLVLTSQLASYTACFRVYRRTLVVDAKLNSEGFCGITELLAHVDLAGGTIIECPAVLESRLFGESKIRIARSVCEHLMLIGRLALRRLHPTRSRPGDA